MGDCNELRPRLIARDGSGLGRARVGVFAAGSKAQTKNFSPGDIGYVKRDNGHYVKNTANSELEFLEVFKGPIF